jgi:hypothetical protein
LAIRDIPIQLRKFAGVTDIVRQLALGLQLLERLTETADEGLLRTAWSHVYNCYTRKEISEAEYNALTRLKDVQKARFAPPAA